MIPHASFGVYRLVPLELHTPCYEQCVQQVLLWTAWPIDMYCLSMLGVVCWVQLHLQPLRDCRHSLAVASHEAQLHSTQLCSVRNCRNSSLNSLWFGALSWYTLNDISWYTVTWLQQNQAYQVPPGSTSGTRLQAGWTAVSHSLGEVHLDYLSTMKIAAKNTYSFCWWPMLLVKGQDDLAPLQEQSW